MALREGRLFYNVTVNFDLVLAWPVYKSAMQIFMSWMGENGWSGYIPCLLFFLAAPSHSLHSSSVSTRTPQQWGERAQAPVTSIITTLFGFIGWSWSVGQRHSRGGQGKSWYPRDKEEHIWKAHTKVDRWSVFLQFSTAQCGFGLGKVRSESPTLKLDK